MAKCVKLRGHYDLAVSGTGNAAMRVVKSSRPEHKSINQLVAPSSDWLKGVLGRELQMLSEVYGRTKGQRPRYSTARQKGGS